jgi:lipopolysaccharide/colanic/teichoic acid biosynthesis glycosyltransferase
MHTTQSVVTYHTPNLRSRWHFRNAAVKRAYGKEAERFIALFIDIGSDTTEVLATSTLFNIEAINSRSIRAIVNMKRLNDIENINEFLAGVNRKLPYDGIFIGCVETIDQRMCRIIKKYPIYFSYPYYWLDFLLKRVFPKWGPTKKVYKLLTRGINRAMSITETLGRLSVFGFNIEEYSEVNGITFFVVRKIARPVLKKESSYGMVIKLRRLGKGGEMIDIFKFRTMHPYAEFLQEYVHTKNKLGRGGKFNNDFRITSWGKFMRKFWLDEIPMLYNWLRGDLKLIGIRPLSKQYFTLYPEEFRKRRINYTPGLIPPFYFDLPETIEEIIHSEIKYLDAYDVHPRLTDIRYLCTCIYHIVVNGARSK